MKVNLMEVKIVLLDNGYWQVTGFGISAVYASKELALRHIENAMDRVIDREFSKLHDMSDRASRMAAGMES